MQHLFRFTKREGIQTVHVVTSIDNWMGEIQLNAVSSSSDFSAMITINETNFLYEFIVRHEDGSESREYNPNEPTVIGEKGGTFNVCENPTMTRPDKKVEADKPAKKQWLAPLARLLRGDDPTSTPVPVPVIQEVIPAPPALPEIPKSPAKLYAACNTVVDDPMATAPDLMRHVHALAGAWPDGWRGMTGTKKVVAPDYTPPGLPDKNDDTYPARMAKQMQATPIKRATIPVDLTNLDRSFTVTRTTEANLQALTAAYTSGIPCLIEGCSAAGKSRSVAELGRLLGTEVVRFTMCASVDANQLIAEVELDGGAPALKLRPFAQAFTGGHILLLDELNLATEKTLQAIEAALDTGKLLIVDPASGTETTRVLEMHPDFRLFATQNPADELFAGHRTALSSAFLSRFQRVEFQPIPVEEHVAFAETALSFDHRRLSGSVCSIHRRAIDLMKGESGALSTVTIRELLAVCGIINRCPDPTIDAVRAIALLYCARSTAIDSTAFREEIRKTLPPDIWKHGAQQS